MGVNADTFWKLQDVRDEFRKLVGRRSTNQLSNADVDTRINRFLTGRLPALLDLKDLESFWQIQTNENVEVYDVPYDSYTIRGPGYVNGSEMEIIHDVNQFYDQHPQTFKTRENIDSGDGGTSSFSGNLSKTPVSYRKIAIDDDFETFRVQENDTVAEILITDITQANPAVVTTAENHNLSDDTEVQIQDVLGMEEINGTITDITSASGTTFTLSGVDSSDFSAYTSGGTVIPQSVTTLIGDKGGSGTVTNSSGAYSITFNTAPADGQDIRANYEFYTPGIPVASLLYGSKLYLSPVPDGVYLLEIPIVGRPLPLINEHDRLAFDSWGYLVAYGAAIDFLNGNAQHEEAALLEQVFQKHVNEARFRDIKNEFGEIPIPRF